MVVKAGQGGSEMLGWHKLKPALFAADLNADNGSFPRETDKSCDDVEEIWRVKLNYSLVIYVH